MRHRARLSCAAFLIASLPPFCAAACAAADKSKGSSPNTNQPSYEQPQPQRETLDLNMYQRIREEGLNHSHVMEYASALDDDIGPRLTGSESVKHANEWTRDQFTAMGCANAHLEDWGEFGMGWQQLNTWVRMTSPGTAVFIAQAAPWSPATNGAVTAPAVWMEVKDEKDLDKYKGRLAGKIVLYGAMREVPHVEKPLWTRLDDAELKKLTEYPVKPRNREWMQDFAKRLELRRKVAQFMADELRWRSSSPAAMGATAAVPAERSSTTAAPDSPGRRTSARTWTRSRLS